MKKVLILGGGFAGLQTAVELQLIILFRQKAEIQEKKAIRNI